MTEYEMHSLTVLNRIAIALETIAMTNAPAPNFVKPIEAFSNFDFSTIGASVKQMDTYGPSELEWGGYLWTRRSPTNKFGEAIWYSRAIGKDAEGNNKYARLISFKKMSEAEPMPRKVEALVTSKPAPQDNGHSQSVASTAVDPVVGGIVGIDQWPTTKSEFESWIKAKSIKGQDIRSALGTDVQGWLKLNAGQTYRDVAITLSATLEK